jgi:hypothetical protein
MKSFLLLASALCALAVASVSMTSAADAGTHAQYTRATLPATQPLSLDQYRARVHSVRTRLDSAAAQGSATAGTLNHIKGQLRALTHVRLSDGRVISTDAGRLVGELAVGDASSIRTVARRLDLLDDATRVAPRSPASSAQLSALDDVLKDPRFHPHCAPVDCLLTWIGDRLSGGRDWIGGAIRTSVEVSPLFAILLLAMLIGIAVLAARGALNRMIVPATVSESTPEPVTSADAEARADRQVAAGDYRSALRYLFLATLLALQERGALELRPGMTNREYLQSLRTASSTGLPVSLAALVDAFDRTWYGHLPFDAEDYARCRALADQVLQEIPTPEAA